MTHPEISDWADYLRLPSDRRERAAMQSHIDGGCEPCRAVLNALERVVDSADPTCVPPTGAVSSVKAFFAVQHPRSHGDWRLVKLRTAFDSWEEPASAAG